MTALVVVENVRRWPFRLRGAEVVPAHEYLMDPHYAARRGFRVYNLCRTYGYQKLGYYVSLLAAARRHRPLPSVETLQDLRLTPLLRIVSEDLDALIQKTLARLVSDRFELSIYFGRNMARRYDPLCRALYNQFPAPLLRAGFARHDDEWRLRAIRPIATNEIPESHRDFVIEQAADHFLRGHQPPRERQKLRYDLAILTNPEDETAPSDSRALRRFVRAARQVGIEATLIDREEYGEIAEFDALFIRETTRVAHHTYRFARRAAAEGLVVIDDPESILRCSNKVYQYELFANHGVPSPRSLVVYEGNADEVERRIGLPCVLKRPDGSFSQGVIKVDSAEQLRARLTEFLRDSDLVIAQAFTPSRFDWRIGVLDRRPLFACRYHMAPGHWQIAARGASGRARYGKVETVALGAAPEEAVEIGVRAANLIGDGFYGVDVKEVEGRFLVMEVNDNPNVEAGCEDAVLGEELYLEVMRWFRRRLDARGNGGAAR